MSCDNEWVKTSLRLPAKLLKELQHACIDRGLDQQDAIIGGIQLWIAQPDVRIPEMDPADAALVMAFPRFLIQHPRESEAGAKSGANFVRAVLRDWLGKEPKPAAVRKK